VCTSCYGWRTWNTSDPVPTDWYGAADKTAPAATLNPVHAGMWEVGDVDNSLNFNANRADGGSAVFPNIQSVSYISAGKTCPPMKTTTDPTKAIQYHGNGVCMDVQKRGMFFPYATTSCAPFPDYTGVLLAGA